MSNQCKDCGKPISPSAKRCRSCGIKARWAAGVYDSEEYRQKLSDSVKKACQRPEVKQKKSEAAKESWQDPEVWEKHSESMKAAHARGDHDNSEAMKAAWARGDFDEVFTSALREKMAQAVKEACQRPEIKEIKSEAAKRVWERQEYQEQISQARKAAWENGIYDDRPNPWDDPEYRQAQMERMLGENNPNWAGGISKEPYGEEWTRQLRLYIRKRDGYQCAICGIPEDGQAHDCHHIDYCKQTNIPSNLISLCKPCHARTNHNRRFWRTLLAPVARRREERTEI